MRRVPVKICRNSVLLVGLLFAGIAAAQSSSGAGATLPQKAYVKWSETFAGQGGKPLKYEGIGSGGGVQAIKERKADFGASDIPLKLAALQDAGLRQFPTLLSAIVPVVNLPYIRANDLKLDGATLADIMSGKIKNWNDPAVRELNPHLELQLPNMPITVIFRADRSGSTALISAFLSSASPAWKSSIGEGQELKWPVGTGVKGTSGMAEAVAKTAGAVGYIDFADVTLRNLTTVSLRNQFNLFVSPTIDTIGGAAKFAEWKKNQFDEDPVFDVSLVNQPGNKVWPIVTATFILLPTDKKSLEKNKDVLKFFDWALSAGDDEVAELGYVPLPPLVKIMVKASWKTHFSYISGK